MRLLVDIRTIPRSRHTPQFNREELSRRLPRRGIRYRHFPALGGLRKPRADSPNTAWRNSGFRGFADYMTTREFAAALQEVRKMAREEGPAALMCAEAVPWRCHRSLVADALTARGDEVFHIMGSGKGHFHEMVPWAKLEGKRVTYPGPPPGASRPETPAARRATSTAAGARPRIRRAAARAAQERLL